MPIKPNELLKYIDKNDLWIDTFILAVENDYDYTHIEVYGKIIDNKFSIRMPDNSTFDIPINPHAIDSLVKSNYQNERLLAIIKQGLNQRFILDTSDETNPTNWIKLIVEDFVNQVKFNSKDDFLKQVEKAHEKVQESNAWKDIIYKQK